jgi:HD-GYP domain-containing protein (c-di-GMP phosphodiesterase class II)
LHKDTELLGNEQFLGARLTRDICNKSGALVLAVHTELETLQLRKLQMHQIELAEQDVVRIGAFVTNKGYEHRDAIEEAVKQASRIFEEMRYLKRIPLMEIRNHILPIIELTTADDNLFGLFSALQSRDDYTYRHHVAVGIVSNLIGRWLGWEGVELVQLTIAGTLHDVGKVKLPAELISRPSGLTEEEYAQVKEHTTIGYELIKETVGMNHRQAIVALKHHERLDGSGYPFGLKGDQIDNMSRIVAVADIFHAMTSKRSYHDAAPFFKTMQELQEYSFGKLDPHVVQVFMKHMMESMIGQEVLLSDGRKAKVVLIHPQAVLRPVVYFEDGNHLDLSRVPSLQIAQVIV